MIGSGEEKEKNIEDGGRGGEEMRRRKMKEETKGRRGGEERSSDLLEGANETAERDVGRLVGRVAAGTDGRQTADGVIALQRRQRQCDEGVETQ